MTAFNWLAHSEREEWANAECNSVDEWWMQELDWLKAELHSVN